MDKNYLLAKLEEKSKKEAKRDSLVAITAHQDFILEALQKKYSLKSIYTVLNDEGVMTVTYQAFVRAVRLHLLGEKRIPSPKTTPVQSLNESDTYDPQAQREKLDKLKRRENKS